MPQSMRETTISIPPASTIESRVNYTPNNSRPDYRDSNHTRIWGLFGIVTPDDELVRTVEVHGNIAPYHTCCGGMRFSAIRTHVFQKDTSSWTRGHGPVCLESQRRYDEACLFEFWQENLQYLPRLHVLMGVPASTLIGLAESSYGQIGSLIACATIKSIMRSYHRGLAVNIDRTNGVTSNTLRFMHLVDGVEYNGTPHIYYEGARPIYTRAFSNTYDIGAARPARVAFGHMVRNPNSGNMLHTVSVLRDSRDSALEHAVPYRTALCDANFVNLRTQEQLQELRKYGDALNSGEVTAAHKKRLASIIPSCNSTA